MRSPEELVLEARKARAHAYAPYSGYAVGAAAESPEGHLALGCNVENISFPATLCAERNAIAALVQAGAKEIAQIALVTEDGGFPCGICLQVMSEFASDPAKLFVHIGDRQSYRFTKTLAELLPYGFSSDHVQRTQK